MPRPSRGPEKRFRIGAVSAAVWLNEHDGRTFRNVDLQRSYRDESGEWKATSSFSLSDLPAAVKVLQMALDYVADCEATATD